MEQAERKAENGKKVSNILLVEDHSSFRQALAYLFDTQEEFSVVGQAGSLEEARHMLDGVDIAVVDLTLGDGFGGNIIPELRRINRKAMVLVLTASIDRMDFARAIEAGAAGVLHKSAGLDEILDTVRRLKAGEAVMPISEVVDLMRLASSRRHQDHEAQLAIQRLTPREKEVLQALAEGLDSKEIARRLHITVETERTHMVNILNKLGVHSRLQALVFAARYGIVDLSSRHSSFDW